jgi:hypothetical protein
MLGHPRVIFAAIMADGLLEQGSELIVASHLWLKETGACAA